MWKNCRITITPSNTSYDEIDISILFRHRDKVYLLGSSLYSGCSLCLMGIQSTHSCLRYQYKHLQHLWNNVYKCYMYIWTESPGMFNCIKPLLFDFCTNYEYNQSILLWDVTTDTYNWWTKFHNYSNLVQNHMLYYMHQQHMVPQYDNWRLHQLGHDLFQVNIYYIGVVSKNTFKMSIYTFLS